MDTDILKDLKELCDELGHVPTHQELVKLKKFNLRNRIITSGIKISEYAIALGFEPKSKPRNYWTEEKLIEEYRKVCEIHDGWPTREIWKQYPFLRLMIHRSGKSHEYYRDKISVHHLAGMKEKECEQCQKIFTPEIGKNTSRQRFCSYECDVNYFRIKQNEKNALKLTIPKICPICGDEFLPKLTISRMYCYKNCRVKFRKKMDKSLRRCLEAMNRDKDQKSYKLLGYTPEDLLKHLQQFPRWDELKKTNWELDHIFPVKAFTDHNIQDIGLICCLENLQPLSRDENNSKGSTYDKQEFANWLHFKGVINNG